MNEQKTLRVGIWTAVSSRAQAADDKASLQDQERAGREFAASIGGQVVAVYAVPGHTRDLWNWNDAEREMDAYRQLREDAEAGRLDVLHVLEMSRLGRDPALAQAAVSMLERNGVEVYNAASPHTIGQRSIGNRFAESIQMISAQEEQRKRVYRAAVGMRRRARRGLFAPSVPAGYDPIRDARGHVIGARLNEYAGAVQAATAMFLRGVSYDAIAEAMDELPYPPPRDGEHWQDSTIRWWMQCDTYAGYTSWGDARADEPSERFPALWDSETFQAILRERDRRRNLKATATSTPFLGVAFCGRCGWRMTRATKSYAVYLRCSKHARSVNRRLQVAPCHPNHIRESIVQAVLVEFLTQVNDTDTLNAHLVEDSTPDASEQRLEEIERLLADYTHQRRRLANALAAGSMEQGIYAEVDGEKRTAIDRLHEERQRIQERRRQIVPLPRRLWAVGQVRDLFERGMEVVANSEINIRLLEAGIRIEVEDREVVRIGFV